VIESEFLPSAYGAPGGNYVNTAAGLAIGTTTTKVKTANAIEYTIDGIRYSKAATDDLFTMTGMDTTASTKYNGAFLYPGITWPDPVVADKCCIGYVTVVKSDGAFTGGTTALNAANVTAAYTDGVSGTNSSTFGLTDQLVPSMGGLRLTSDYEIYYSTSAHAIAGFVYIVVKGGFE
jgi:hypothetical protein